MDLCIAYKNLDSKNVTADDVMDAKLLYGGKYEFTGFSTIEEENRGNFTYTNITSIAPLMTEYLHYLFEVPEEVETSEEPIEISFNIGENIYTYVMR